MANPIKTRTSVAKAFRNANELDPSELPAKLEVLQKYVFDNIEYDCRHFAGQISIWKDNDLYKYFEPTWEDFIAKHIKQPIEWVNHMLNGVSILDCSQPIKASDAIAASQAELRKSVAQEGAKTAEPIKPHGGNRNPEGLGGKSGKKKDCQPAYKQVDNKPNVYGSDNPEYLAARIARDRPDIQEKMKQGAYPSVRAAAVDAGIVKPRVQVTWKAEATPEEIAQAVIKKIPDGLEEDVIKAMMQIIL